MPLQPKSFLGYRGTEKHLMIKRWPEFAVFVFFLAGTLLLLGRIVSAQSSPYSQWTNGPSTSPNFFPIGVWLQNPGHAQEFQNIDVNLFGGFFVVLGSACCTEF